MRPQNATGAEGGARVVVIGGGIAGLATSALLARDGYRVTLLERNDDVGGRARTWESGGFRFDAGPSWYLMPEVFEHFFRLLGTSAAEQLDLVPLDPAYRVIFGGRGEPMDLRATREQNMALFDAVEPGAGARLARYLDSARSTYEVAVKRFLYTSFQSYATFLRPDVLRRAGRLARLLTEPLDTFAGRFVSDPRLRQILGYPAVFLGASPFSAPSLFHLMSHLDLEGGVLYPRGGFGRVIGAIERLAAAAGVEILTGADVAEIRTGPSPRGRRPRVTGVAYRDRGVERFLAADVVVSAADLHHTETELLPPALRTYPEPYWEKRVPGPGALLIHLGVRGELPELLHHTLLFTGTWREDFEKIFGARPAVPEPASLYVCRPSATDNAVAPGGHENLFVLVPVPADPAIGAGGRGGAGDPSLERAADAVIGQISEWAGIPDLAERIVLRRTVGPADFASELNAWRGTALGPAHVLRQSAFFRSGNASRKVGGLYYAGSSTIPGIGLPMCLISAEILLKRLRGDRSAEPLAEPLADRRVDA